MQKRVIVIIVSIVAVLGVVCALTIPAILAQRESSSVRVDTNARVDSPASTDLQPVESVTSETYTVSRGDITLYGVITASENYRQEKRPLIVISHGFNNTLEIYDEYADNLARQGFVVYRFDFYGGSTQSKSGGRDMHQMSVLTERDDLDAVVGSLSKEPFVDAAKVSLLGASQGGVVSTLYAAQHPDSIHQLILIFPAFVLFDDVRDTYNRLGVSSVDQIPPVITHKNASLGSIYLRDALGIDIHEEMRKVTAPVLIIQGTNDEVVPYRYATDAQQTFPQAEVVTVRGGTHWTSQSFNQIAIPAIDSFVRR